MRRYEQEAYEEYLLAVQQVNRRFARNEEILMKLEPLQEKNKAIFQIYDRFVDQRLDALRVGGYVNRPLPDRELREKQFEFEAARDAFIEARDEIVQEIERYLFTSKRIELCKELEKTLA